MSQIAIKDLDYLELLKQAKTEDIDGGAGFASFSGNASASGGSNFNIAFVTGTAIASPSFASSSVTVFALAS